MMDTATARRNMQRWCCAGGGGGSSGLRMRNGGGLGAPCAPCMRMNTTRMAANAQRASVAAFTQHAEQQHQQRRRQWVATPTPAAARAPPRRRCGTTIAAAAAAAAADADAQQRDVAILLDARMPPAPYVGPVKVARYVGTGRGLEATRTLAAGELVLVCEPLALLEQSGGDDDYDYDEDEDADAKARASKGAAAGGADSDDEGEADEDGAEGDGGGGGDTSGGAYVPTDDDVDALVAKLEAAAAVDPSAAAWLDALDDGHADADAALPDLAQLSAGDGGGGAPAAAQQLAPAQALDADRLADIVDVNFWAAREDAAAAVLRAGEGEGDAEAAPRDLVGVWPAAALLNHSCAPNTSVVAVEGRLVVRAARAVPKQMELTASYLSGAQLLSPLSERRTALRAARGFDCRCARCRDEARLEPQMARLVDEVAGACRALEADLTDAVVSGGARATERLADQLAAYVELVDAAFNKLALPARTQTFVQASLFKLYALTALATSAAGNEQPRLVELLAALAGEVAPGSEEHAYWARRYRAVVDEVEGEDGRFDGALRQADGVCKAAHTARYGALPFPLYRKLLAAAEAAEAAEAGWDDNDELEDDDDDDVIQIV